MGMPEDDTAKAKPKMKIGHLGTFDVENYGDLLFPMLAERRLQSRIPELILDPISPVGSESLWQDSPSSIGYDDFSKHREGYRGFLVGGGNIIRVTPSDLDMYQKDPFFSYSNLWAGIAALNENNNLPICWNSPGVPSSLPLSLRPRLRSYLERVDYLCVRDEKSCDFLREVAPDVEISVTPDPAWDIDKIWTAEALEAAHRNAFLSRKADVPDRSVAIHLNSRYLGEADPEKLGTHLDALCRGLKATGILIAIGPCHGDDVLASSVAAKMKTNPLLIDRPASLKETAACIAGSVAYIGSSMHGFITASSFCIPAVVVAASSMVKFPGMLSQIGLPNLIHQTWPGAVEHVTQLGSADYIKELQGIRNEQQKLLDHHWLKIADTFQNSRHQTSDGQKVEQLHSNVLYRETLLAATATEIFARLQLVRKRLRRRETQVETLKGDISKREKKSSQQLAKQEVELIQVKAALETLVDTLEDTKNDNSRLTGLLRAGRTSGVRAFFEGIRATPSTNQRLRAQTPMYLHYLLMRRRRDAHHLALLAASGFFDADFYLQDNEDVAKSGADPLIHFVDIGAAEGRNPSALFDTRRYLQFNSDVAASGINPLLHFILYGRNEGRKPRPRISPNATVDWPAAPLRPARPTRPIPESIVIYTAVTGGYDELQPPEIDLPNCRFVAFSDQPLKVEGWETRPLDYFHHDPTRAARFAKLHPHLYFPEFDHSIWIDANIGIRGDIRTFFSCLDDDQFLGIFLHPLRDCIYVEAEECIKRRKDHEHVIRQHVERYRANGFPSRMGLWETNVLVRHHNLPACKALMTAWWRELEIGSRRDQLSLPVVAQRMSARIAALGNPGDNARQHPLVTLTKHRSVKSVAPPSTEAPFARKEVDLSSVSIDIGVCVHNSLAEVQNCLNSLISARRPQDDIVIVDDASDSPTATFLDDFASKYEGVTLIRHEKNLGYTQSANDVLKNTDGDWVVLLNSDTVVPPSALQKLISCGERFAGAGIVGPLSNAAGWQTVPTMVGPDGKFLVNEIPRPLTADDMDRMCEELSVGVAPLVPLVNGFCYAIRRSLIDRIGLFDATHFPIGYGEEDDYCLRAGAAGFLCAIATDAYVYHAKSATFTPERRAPLAAAGGKALRKKHSPERVAAAVDMMKRNPELARVRDRLSLHLQAQTFPETAS